MGQEHAEAVEEMRAILAERGTVSNRDFAMATRKRTQSYRGRKDSALALYYLWRSGEAMTHHRENFERVYALAENVARAQLLIESEDAEADRFLIKEGNQLRGARRQLKRTADAFHRGAPFGKGRQIVEALLAEGEIIEVEVEGWKGARLALGSDERTLNELRAGGIPAGVETAGDDHDGGGSLPFAAGPGGRARESQGAVRLRLRLGGLQT